MLIDPVVYLEAKALQKDLKVIAQYRQHEHGYLFTHVNSGITNIKQLKGRSLVFPDPYHACSITAKALLVDAGITARDLLAFTNVTDTGIKWTRDRTTRPIVSYRETVVLVSSNQYEAGLTLDRRYVQLHPKLQSLLTFDDFPKIVAVRAGLENRIVVALRQSLLETGQFVLIGDANLEPLKEKMEKAERFEPAPKASAASLNSNSGRALPPPVPAP